MTAIFSTEDVVIHTAGQVGGVKEDAGSLRVLTYDTRPARETFRRVLEAPPPREKQ